MDLRDEDQPWTASSLAEAAGVTHSYISRLCRVGQIKARKVGPVWMIPYEEGQRWLERREARSESTEAES